MKLNLLTLIFCIIPSLFFGQILEENFDDITDLESKGWIISNQSSPTGMIDWFQGNTAVFDSHNGEANAYIASNYNSVDSFGTISNWLISPTVSVRDGDVLSFWTRTSTNSIWNDRLEVRSSQGTMTLPSGPNDVGSFTNVMLIINDDYDLSYPDYWFKYEIEITNVGDEPVGMNFAFRYNVISGGSSGSNSNYIGIDTVLIIDNYVPEPGCLDAPNGVFPADTFTPNCNGLEEIITSDAQTGQYSNVNVIANNEYIFSSSVTTDYIIVSDESGENILAEGFSPLTWTPSADQTVRFYLLLDDECNFSDEIRQKIVQCGEELGISDLNSIDFTYYPNPVKDQLNIHSKNKIAQVEIFNMNGQRILLNQSLDQNVLDLSSLKASTYIIRATLENGTIETFKIIKQ